MSKVKQWAWDTAEKAVDIIIDKLKNKNINVETAKSEILKVLLHQRVNLLIFE